VEVNPPPDRGSDRLIRHARLRDGASEARVTVPRSGRDRCVRTNTQPGQVLDPARILVSSMSNFGEPVALAGQLPGSFLSIDPRGAATLVIPPMFAANGGQAMGFPIRRPRRIGATALGAALRTRSYCRLRLQQG
jgi:hypothetical protein